MAAKRPPYYFEPWRAARDTSWNVGFQSGPPLVDDPDLVDRWHAAKARAEQAAKVHLFGSGLHDPAVTYSLLGTVGVSQGVGIVATVNPVHHDHPKGADHVQVGERIAACVNACAGIADPVATLQLARDLLWEVHKGYTDGDDLRVVKLLDKLHPPEDFLGSQRRIFGEDPP